MISDKEQDKLLKAAFERRASSVPPLSEGFAERVLKAVERRRPDGRRTVALWASGIAAALLVGFLLWPREQTRQSATVATPVVAEVIETETNLPAQAPSAPVKESKESSLKEKPAPKKPHAEEKPAEKAHSVLPLKGEGGSVASEGLPIIPPDKQPLVDIYLAEEALQVEYMLREPLEKLQEFYASFEEEEPDTTVHIIAI